MTVKITTITMKSIYNPTEKDVSILIKGIAKTVEAGATEIVTDEFAADWVATHSFLQVSEVKETPVVEKKEVKETETEDRLGKQGFGLSQPIEDKKEVKKESIIKKAVKAVSKK